MSLIQIQFLIQLLVKEINWHKKQALLKLNANIVQPHHLKQQFVVHISHQAEERQNVEVKTFQIHLPKLYATDQLLHALAH
jgi:hypothetical protein